MWTDGVGFVTRGMIEKHMPADGVGSATHLVGHKVLMCGPPPMMSAMKWVGRMVGMVLWLMVDLGRI